MKVFVLGYGPRKELDETHLEENPLTFSIETHDIWYSKEPEWTMNTRVQAESELEILSGMTVHVREHYCEFSVEELSEENFAIACLAHPTWSTRASADPLQDRKMSLQKEARESPSKANAGHVLQPETQMIG